MLSPIEQFLLFVMVFALMVGVGCSLTVKEFLSFRNNKKAFCTGLCLQYVSMPLLALAVVYVFKLDPASSLALVLVACCPGGTTSNMFTYLARGGVNISVILTTTTSILAFVLSPILLSHFAGSLPLVEVEIPLKNIAMTLVFALFPIVIGLLIRASSEIWARRVERVGSILGYLAIAIMVVIWFPKIRYYLDEKDFRTFLATGALSFFGILFAKFFSKKVGLSRSDQIALSFENGIQNAPLAFALITLSFPKELSQEVSWVALVYGALSVGNAAIFTAFYLRRSLPLISSLRLQNKAVGGL